MQSRFDFYKSWFDFSRGISGEIHFLQLKKINSYTRIYVNTETFEFFSFTVGWGIQTNQLLFIQN